ncbi:uncharacterized protein LOC127869785 [Dreissena polymorpha]|uniref:uncharacterized protein LOC127869785 n=1 Tax=Dreissena polymorpha TaxID=45954 RepID=UPI0022647DC8|nr:uncharacterized protein LOC127869785 [Dreissena polymorpha]
MQYVDLGSSQQCEHANKEVSLRAPKSHHYGNSASLDYHAQATAAFINDGRQYISESYSKMGLSPGALTDTYATKCMKPRLDKLQMASLPSSKRRRLVLKQERSTNQGANEALEGDMYKSGIVHQDSPDTEQIPDTIPKGIFKPVILPGKPTIITFDLETTGLIEGRVLPQVTQIAAVELQSGRHTSHQKFQ